MKNVVKLQHESARFVELRRRLLDVEPDLDQRTLLDTLEGMSDLREAIAEVVRSALEDRTMASALRQRLDDLKERLRRIERREEMKRDVALRALEESGLENLTTPDCTISLRPAPPAVMVTDEEAIPEWFWRPQPPKLDKQALLNAIKAGEGIEGAALANARMVLSVRTR